MMRAVMNSKAVKKLHQQLAEQYGFQTRMRHVFLLHEKKQKVSLLSEAYRDIDLSTVRIDTLGLYFGAWFDNRFRLTIEGTQIIGPECTKNVVTITYPEMQKWMLGESLIVEELANAPDIEQGAFVILRCGTDFLGCGKLAQDKILNYIPKTRYVHALY